jgi:CBS domain-containing protein
MKIKDIMTTEVGVCSPDSNLASVVSTMWNKDCGAVPVVNDGKVVGIITDRDIAVAAATTNQPLGNIPVSAVVNGTVHTCQAEDSVDNAIAAMQENKVRRLPVTDADGALQGIVSVNDLVRHAGKSTSAKTKTVAQKDVFETLKAISAAA